MTDVIKNKTILLICKEEFTYPMFFLGQKLEKNNNDIHYYFIHNTEVIELDKFNSTTYFYFKKKFKKQNIHDVKDINLEFIKNRRTIKVDHGRLKEIEKKYTYFKGLNKQILSAQATSTPYHDRFYYRSTTYNENLYWLMLNYNKTEDVLNSIKPDYIFDINMGEIQRTIINEVANYKRIPYVIPEDARYKNIKIPTFNLGLEPEKFFIDEYKKNKIDKNLNKYIKEVQNYVAQSSIMPQRYKDNKEWQNNFSNKYSFRDALSHILNKTLKQIKFQIYYFRNNKNRIKYNLPLNSNPVRRVLWNYIYAVRKFYLFSNVNKYFLEPCDEKYILLPLHVIPENSTYVKGTMYLNQLNLIEAISKSLPISWKLYVKEHPNMIGQRSIEFYKKAAKFHNVKLVKLNGYKDSKSWIEKSLGVITITGSTALEAALLNKPAIVFGNSCFNVLSNIKFANSLNELESIFNLIKTDNWSKDNEISHASYLKTIQDLGVDLDIWRLVTLSSKKICSEVLGSSSLTTTEDDELTNLVKQLIIFNEKAIRIYDGQI